MKYREQLLEFIYDDDLEEDAMMNWVASMPLIEQPDILREFEALVRELAAEQGRDIETEFPEIEGLKATIAEYEDKILDEKLAEANLVMAQQDLDKKMLEVDEAVSGVREYVMDCIVNNEDNAEAMRELAEKMMQSEKDNDMFDAKNWSRIL
jgi:hypothetical protein